VTATAAALACASFCTSSFAVGAVMARSSTSLVKTEKSEVIRWSSSCLRGLPDAKISMAVSPLF